MKKAAATIASIRRQVATFGAPQGVIRYGAPLLLAVALGAGPLGGPARAGGPFEQIAGTWSGKGRVTFEGGNSEALACTAYYVSRDAGRRAGSRHPLREHVLQGRDPIEPAPREP